MSLIRLSKSNDPDVFHNYKESGSSLWHAVMIVCEHCMQRYTPVQAPPVSESPFNSIGPTPKCPKQNQIARYSSIPGDSSVIPSGHPTGGPQVRAIGPASRPASPAGQHATPAQRLSYPALYVFTNAF